jgi:hypothetical protein
MLARRHRPADPAAPARTHGGTAADTYPIGGR